MLLPSFKSIFIEARFENLPISNGTAFVVETGLGYHLVTNRHIVTGLDNMTGEKLSTLGTPNNLVVHHNRTGQPGAWIRKREDLFNHDGQPLWYEHPTLGPKGDFVLLPLTETDEVAFYPYSMNNDIMISAIPSDRISVIGYPFGLFGGLNPALWTTGYVASEPSLDHASLPVFLIDCRSRPGQSGSPVVAHRNGGSVPIEGGNRIVMLRGPATRLLGIYSGRINKNSDLGMVWKKKAIKELIDSLGPVRGNELK